MFGVPSSSISVPSSAAWSTASRPVTAVAISPLTLPTAWVTPLPPYVRAAVAQLGGLELAGRGARRDGRAAGRAGAQGELDLDGRVASRVEDLAGVDAFDLAHGSRVSVLFLESGLRVVGELASGFEVVPARAVSLGETLGGLDARAKPIGRGPQRELRVDLQLARDVDGGEEQVAAAA